MRLLSNSLVSGPKGGSLDLNIFPGITAPEDKPEGLFVPIEKLGKIIFDDATYVPQAGYAPYQVQGLTAMPTAPAISGYNLMIISFVQTVVGKVYRVCLYTASGTESEKYIVQAFDTDSKLWSTILDQVSFSITRTSKTFGVFDNKLYCLGGQNYDGSVTFSKKLLAIDLATGLLTTLADAPYTGAWYAQPSKIGNNLYWPGRYQGDASNNRFYGNTMYIYNITTNLWTQKVISGTTNPYICGGVSYNIDDKLWVLPQFGVNTIAGQTSNKYTALQDAAFIYDPASDLITTTGVTWASGIASLTSSNILTYFGRKIYYTFATPYGSDSQTDTNYGLAMVDVDTKVRTVLHQRKVDNAASLISAIVPRGFYTFLFCDAKALWNCNSRNDGITYFGYSKIVLEGDTYPVGTVVLWFSNANPHVVIADSDDLKIKTGIRAVLRANVEGYLEFVSGAQYKVLGGYWTNV